MDIDWKVFFWAIADDIVEDFMEDNAPCAGVLYNTGRMRMAVQNNDSGDLGDTVYRFARCFALCEKSRTDNNCTKSITE